MHAFVLEGGTAQHREERAGDGGLADQPLEGGLVGFAALEICGHGLVVELDRSFDHLLAIFPGLLEQISRDLNVVVLGAEGFVVPHHALHAHEIDDALELLLGSDWQLDGDRLGAETVHDIGQALEKIGADLIHLVAEYDARNLVLVALAPHCLGLRLHSLIAVEHANRAVEHAQAALHFDGEVNMSRSVDDVMSLAAPQGGGRRRCDRDTALLLLLHPVHGGRALMDLAHLVALSGVVEDPLGRGRLAGIDVGHDAEIAVILDGMAAGHTRLSPRISSGPVTSDSARTPDWPRPCDACPRAS